MDIRKEGVDFKDYIFTKFNPKSVVFLRWLNSFEYVFEMSDTGDDEKVNCLLNMLEPLVLQKLVKKAFPSKLVNLSYNEIITLLENTFSSFKGREVPNYRYLFRHQFPYESVEHYALALRRLYGKCSPQFKSLIPIKNRFIEGLLDKETKTLLKKDENISFSMAVFIAQEKELPKDQE